MARAAGRLTHCEACVALCPYHLALLRASQCSSVSQSVSQSVGQRAARRGQLFPRQRHAPNHGAAAAAAAAAAVSTRVVVPRWSARPLLKAFDMPFLRMPVGAPPLLAWARH
jgi:hypothetical protein